MNEQAVETKRLEFDAWKAALDKERELAALKEGILCVFPMSSAPALHYPHSTER